MLNMLGMIDILGRELNLPDFVKYTFNIGLHLDAYEPISFKLGLLIDSVELNRSIPAWQKNLNFCNHSIVK